MSKAVLRWYLWSAVTFAAMGAAGVYGFYGVLLKNDVTYLGISACGLYVATTLAIGFGLARGQKPGKFTWHMVEVIQCLGLLGTFTGISIALFHAVNLDINSPEFKVAVVHAVMTKLLTSICGFVGFLFLSTQLRLLDA